MSNKAYIEISSCKNCPFKKETNFFSSDGWDRMCDWVCTKNQEGEAKKIQGGVEWHEEDKIKVPDWCPISLENIFREAKEKYGNTLENLNDEAKEPCIHLPKNRVKTHRGIHCNECGRRL